MEKLLQFILIIIFLNTFCILETFSDECTQAESLIRKAQAASIEEEGFEYLHQSSDLFLKILEDNPINIKALLGLSKINQIIGNRKEAKVYVIKAYNLNPNNPNLQKAMGDFFFNFQEYSTAIEYYKLSLSSGNLEDFETNLQSAKCYEKLGDLENSQLYYKICNKLKPSSKIVSTKLSSFKSSENDEKNNENPKYKYLFKE